MSVFRFPPPSSVPQRRRRVAFTVQGPVTPSFIGSSTVVYAPSVPEVTVPFISSTTTVYTPGAGGTEVLYTTPGTFTWIAPPGITQVYVECVGGGGGGGGNIGNQGAGGGGGGAYAARQAVPVTPGNTYTVVVGAAGSGGTTATDGGSSTFTGDSSVQVIAVGGSHGSNTNVNGGAGGQASSSTGDPGLVFSGGAGGTGISSAAEGGAGGGASGNKAATGNAGANGTGTTTGAVGGAGANGGGSGGHGGDYTTGSGLTAGSSPGGGGGGAGGFGTGAAGAAGSVKLTVGFVQSFIASRTVVYTPAFPVEAPFIGSTTVVYTPTLPVQIPAPFIASTTTVLAPDLPEVRVPFLSSATVIYTIFSLFDPNLTGTGPGNGGEIFGIRLNANGVTSSATLANTIGTSSPTLRLTGDTGFPSENAFVATIDSEVLYLVPQGMSTYGIRGRGLSNTATASHTAGADVTWDDSYDMPVVATEPIAGSFTANIDGSGSYTYPGWLVAFDSSQAYLAGDRYPIHVAELLGVFTAGAGSTGSNKCDAAQPNAIATTTGTSDDCPAGLGNPSRIQTDIDTGDVALLRYTNPEAAVLDLGPRSAAVQSWFGLKRVDTSDVDVTFTDPNGIVVDTTSGEGTYTGSVNDEWFEPSTIGIGPDTGTPTPGDVPYTSVTLPGTDRYFTYGSPHYSEKGWPFGVLCVRQGNRRVPHWASYDWHNFSYVYSGFGTDQTFAQIVVNRNGIIYGSEPSVALPGPQDITGPDAVWDDDTYYFGVSWYVAIFAGPYLVIGPAIGGSSGGGSPPTPVVGFPGGGGAPGPPTVTIPPIEGGSGGGQPAPGGGLHVWARA